VKDDLVYEVVGSDQYGTSVGFSANSLENMDDNCLAEFGPLVTISNMNGSVYDNDRLSSQPDQVKQFDNNYISFGGPQEPCSFDNNGNPNKQVLEHEAELRKKIKIETVEDIQCIKEI
jgi:hypothetical protein